MQANLELLARKLDRKALVEWVDEMRLGRPAYDYLLDGVRARKFNVNQTANALHALFRLRTHGSDEEVFMLLRQLTNHEHVRIRSEAVKLVIGLIKLHDHRSPFALSNVLQEIKAGLELGLSGDIAALAHDFMNKQESSRN